jgi:teichuronic acid biosynthesis glycosyltransferase TuaH
MQFPGYDIIMLALARWDGPYSSTAFSLAKELSRHTRVFFIDNPVTLKEYLAERNTPALKRRRNALLKGDDFCTVPHQEYPGLYAVTPPLILPVNWLPGGRLYETLSRLNDAAISRTLNKLLHGFGISQYVFINAFNPLFGRHFSLSVRPLLTVYQSVDDIGQTPYLKKHGPRLEQEAIAKADFTIVTSAQLKRAKAGFSGNVFMLPNAADTTLFQRAVKENLAVPPEISQLQKGMKIICYMGNICQRLDYELLKKVAAVHSDKVLLMVGPTTRVDHGAAALRKFPNVIFTGGKPMEALPAYLQHSHCCIIPFLCNQLTKSIYPLKINEYLSAGKAVVTTGFSEDIQSFGEVAWIAENHEEFVRQIQKAIDRDTESGKIERMTFSASNNWEARAHHFIDLTVEFLKHHGRGTGESERRKREQTFYRVE